MLLLFSQLSVVIRLDKVSEINYALLKAPEFTSTYVETQHKVTCMLKPHNKLIMELYVHVGISLALHMTYI